MKKGLLKTALNAAAAPPLALVFRVVNNLTLRLDQAAYPTLSTAPLTAGEVAFVKSIFGNEIKTGRVEKHFSLNEREDAQAITYAANKKIKFYGPAAHSADYSQSENIKNYDSFIHEMTHIWQAQHMISLAYRVRQYNREYEYQLSPQSRFKDFGVEQQASIVADYARQFLFRGSERAQWSWLPGHLMNEQTPESLALLQKVVEDRFPEARRTRLALEAREKTPPKRPPKMK